MNKIEVTKSDLKKMAKMLDSKDGKIYVMNALRKDLNIDKRFSGILCVEIDILNNDVVDWLYERMGGNYYDRMSENHKYAYYEYRWEYGEAYIFLKKVLPYLKNKKIDAQTEVDKFEKQYRWANKLLERKEI